MRPLEVYSQNTKYVSKSIIVRITGQSKRIILSNELGVNLFWNLEVAGQNTTLKGECLESIIFHVE